MKSIIIFTITLLLAATSIAAQSKADKNVEQELLRLHRLEEEAEAKRDIAALERLFNDDFIFIAADGSIYDKKKFIDEIKADTSTPAQQKLDYENFKARVYGKTAMVSYTLSVSGKDKDNKDYTNRYRMSVMWIKQKSAWRITNFHSTRVRN
jgi:ketosteroid isomerase-like protein